MWRAPTSRSWERNVATTQTNLELTVDDLGWLWRQKSWDLMSTINTTKQSHTVTHTKSRNEIKLFSNGQIIFQNNGWHNHKYWVEAAKMKYVHKNTLYTPKLHHPPRPQRPGRSYDQLWSPDRYLQTDISRCSFASLSTSDTVWQKPTFP